MTLRAELLGATAPARYRLAASREQDRFLEFCSGHGLEPTADAVAVYLTSLLRSGAVHGRGFRYRLYLLDLAARLEGQAPPSHYLRGLHRQAALAGPEQPVEPLHQECVRMLAGLISRPTAGQIRDAALLLTAHATGLSVAVLSALTWNDVRFRPTSVELTLPPYPSGRPRSPTVARLMRRASQTCPDRALRAWAHERGPAPGRLLFSLDEAPPDLELIYRPVLRLLQGPTSEGGLTERQIRARLVDLLAPRARARRDLALFLLAFAGGLGTKEAIELRQGDLRRSKQGILMAVPGRTRPTPIPPAQEPLHCAVRAWAAWQRHLRHEGLATTGLPAFLQVTGSVTKPLGIGEHGLNLAVRQRVEQAGMSGHYAFTSLRVGFMRSAARADIAGHVIAAHVGLSALRSVAVHVDRETVLTHNVASLLGL